MDKRQTPQERYDAKATRRYAMKLNLVHDADIIAKLDEVPSMQGYIKDLIRKDLAEKGPSK